MPKFCTNIKYCFSSHGNCDILSSLKDLTCWPSSQSTDEFHAMTTLAVLQPGYLPWLGFFDLLHRCDLFVIYDDVQFDKHGWRNRNRIRSATGPLWLTVPVRHKGLGKPLILDIEIDPNTQWVKKHLGTLEQFYAKAPYVDHYLPEFKEALSRPWRMLVDMDLTMIQLMCYWLGLQRTVYRSSELHIGGERSERLLRLCQHFSADRYLSGNAAKAYLNEALFAQHNVVVEWQNYQHPIYPQLHGNFIPYLSAMDLLFNVGPQSLSILTSSPHRVHTTQ
ncbi:MAG: WbqC family protein [Magnetococcales bacterium]|nr:WbqC family protein [Magnetococcales bacterium]